MGKRKFLLSEKCRKAIATALAGITLLSSISVPVIAEEEKTTVDPNSDSTSGTGTTNPDNAIGVDVNGDGYVVVEQNGKETEINGLTLFYAENGEEITIKASEK